MQLMTSPAQRETKTENFALLASTIAGTAAYLLTLREFYSWWVVAPVALIALPIAMIFSVVVMEFAGTRIGRLICLALAGGLLWTAVTHDDRSGSALMAIFLFVLGVTARRAGRWI